MRILMVCLGNICRSPLAHGILEHKVKALGLNWDIDSAGTGGWHAGELPDPRSIDIARSKGIDITNQRARQFKQNDFDEFDVIYAMDASNFNDINRLARTEEEKEKVIMILNESYPGENRRVPDPYYGGPDGFANVFNLLNEATNKILAKYQ